jgi:hypothetical protein
MNPASANFVITGRAFPVCLSRDRERHSRIPLREGEGPLRARRGAEHASLELRIKNKN